MKASSETSPVSNRQKWMAFAALLAIIASAVWIYRYTSTPTEMNLPLHQSVGDALAEETFHAVGHGGKIVLVTMDASRAPEIKVQMQAFEKELSRLGGCTI